MTACLTALSACATSSRWTPLGSIWPRARVVATVWACASRTRATARSTRPTRASRRRWRSSSGRACEPWCPPWTWVLRSAGRSCGAGAPARRCAARGPGRARVGGVLVRLLGVRRGGSRLGRDADEGDVDVGEDGALARGQRGVGGDGLEDAGGARRGGDGVEDAGVDVERLRRDLQRPRELLEDLGARLLQPRSIWLR